MSIEIGQIEAIYRYPVKSMRGEPLASAAMGWHGIEGDRRFALRRLDARGGFPWLTASKLPELVLFAPQRRADLDVDALPTHVLTPEGKELPLSGEALAGEVGRRCGIRVELMYLDHGIFDDASISVITSETIREIGRLSETGTDFRQFRPNIVVRSRRPVPFEEDEWVGGVITLGEMGDAPTIAVTSRDVRCAMVNIDPDRASVAPEVLKAVVRANQKGAGVYATVTRVGRVAVGQAVVLHRDRGPGIHSAS